jgi:pyruvate dehydrogenase E2 component (dihydrolipoamide acetyltransferase)
VNENINSPRGLPVKQVIPLGRLRRAMAQHMRQSVAQGALSQISRQVDLTEIQTRRRELPNEWPHSLNVYLLAAVSKILPQHPLLNAELVEDRILVNDLVNVGMAIAVSEGLIVAVIHEADRKTIDELAECAEDLATRARLGKLTYEDIEGGTFTFSNLGMFDIDGAFPLPRPPEAAILLVGRTRPRPEVINGEICVCEMAWFNLTYDHRFIDGATGARFLQDLQDLLLGPDTLRRQ